MSSNLDKSLDEIISENPRRRNGGNGVRRNGGRATSSRNSPYTRRNGGGVQKRGQQNQQQQAALAAAQSMMMNPAAFLASGAGQQNASAGKILVSNLDYGVTESDLRELFTQVGPVRRVSLNFGPNGSSRGNGEVTFRNPAHASLAVERYHGVTLDGRKMKIELAFNPMAAMSMMIPSMIQSVPMVAQQQPNGASNGVQNRRSNNTNNNSNGNRNGHNRHSRRGGTGRGRRSGNDKRPTATKEALDADLDSYMQDADNKAPSSSAAEPAAATTN